MSQIERILTIGTYGQSLMIQARLDQEEIPYLIQSFNDPAFGSFWRIQEGWGLLLAPSEYRNRIEEIWSDLRDSSEVDER